MRVFQIIPPIFLLRTSIFIYPTETCYGLGCDAANGELVERVYRIKRRSFTKQVSWIAADVKMAEQYAEFSNTARNVAKKFWPGPLTLVLPLRPEYQALVRSKRVGVRVSSHPIARALSRRLRRPIVATSANVSGEGECYSASEVEAQLSDQKEKPDIIIDGGALLRVQPTTVVKIIGAEIEVIREGEIQF